MVCDDESVFRNPTQEVYFTLMCQLEVKTQIKNNILRPHWTFARKMGFPCWDSLGLLKCWSGDKDALWPETFCSIFFSFF